MMRDMEHVRAGIRNQAALVKGSLAAKKNMTLVRAARGGSIKQRATLSPKSTIKAFQKFYNITRKK